MIDGETIYSVYSQAGVLLHRDNVTENKFTDYIRVAGQSIARVHAGGNIRYAHNDHLGSAVSETNTSSQVRWQQNFTPYGEKRDQAGFGIADTEDEEGFTGHISDATGLTYMQARYYDPVLGRFLSNDPVGFSVDAPQMFNRYSYVHNDPVNNWDPNGEFAVFGAVIGGGLQLTRELRNGSFKGGILSKDGLKAVARIGGSAAVGAVTGGVGGVISKSAVGLAGRQLASTVASNAAKNAAVGSAASATGQVAVNTAEAAIDGGVSGVGQAIADGSVLDGAGSAAVNGAVFGAGGSVAGDAFAAGAAASNAFGAAGTLSSGGAATGVAIGNTVGNLSPGDIPTPPPLDGEQLHGFCGRHPGAC